MTRNDLAKCEGTRCPARDVCDRYVRPAGDRQEWVVVPFERQRLGMECGEFEPVRPTGAPCSGGGS